MYFLFVQVFRSDTPDPTHSDRCLVSLSSVLAVGWETVEVGEGQHVHPCNHKYLDLIRRRTYSM